MRIFAPVTNDSGQIWLLATTRKNAKTTAVRLRLSAYRLFSQACGSFPFLFHRLWQPLRVARVCVRSDSRGGHDYRL